MAKSVKQTKPAATAGNNEQKTAKSNKMFHVLREDLERSTSTGEFPLRTYEMFRNLFVGIN